jgi:hypothetical protein
MGFWKGPDERESSSVAFAWLSSCMLLLNIVEIMGAVGFDMAELPGDLDWTF